MVWTQGFPVVFVLYILCAQNDGVTTKKTTQGDTKQDDTNALYMRDFLTSCNKTIFTLKIKVMCKECGDSSVFSFCLVESAENF